jgi:hypothetical protein
VGDEKTKGPKDQKLSRPTDKDGQKMGDGWRVCRLRPEKELSCSRERGDLPNPEQEHPFDDLCLEVCPVLLGHETLGEILPLAPGRRVPLVAQLNQKRF